MAVPLCLTMVPGAPSDTRRWCSVEPGWHGPWGVTSLDPDMSQPLQDESSTCIDACRHPPPTAQPAAGIHPLLVLKVSAAQAEIISCFSERFTVECTAGISVAPAQIAIPPKALQRHWWLTFSMELLGILYLGLHGAYHFIVITSTSHPIKRFPHLCFQTAIIHLGFQQAQWTLHCPCNRRTPRQWEPTPWCNVNAQCAVEQIGAALGWIRVDLWTDPAELPNDLRRSEWVAVTVRRMMRSMVT